MQTGLSSKNLNFQGRKYILEIKPFIEITCFFSKMSNYLSYFDKFFQ